MDMPPRQARAVKRLMGIDPNYFLAVPAGDDAAVQDAVAYLRRLGGGARPDLDKVQ
jgi:hypothetical protein